MKTIAYIAMIPELIPRLQLQVKTLLENKYKVIHIGWDRRKDSPKEKLANGVHFIRIPPYLSKKETNRSDMQSIRTTWGVPGQRGLRVLKTLPLLYFNFFKTLKKEAPDIIHCTHAVLLPIAVFWGSFKRIKVVYEASDFYISHSLERLPRSLAFLKKIAISLEGLLVRHVDAVFCIPSFEKQLLKNYAKYNSVVCEILNVPVLESTIDKELYNDLNKKYENKKVLVYAGAISIKKGVMNVVRAVNNARRQHPNVKLILIGSSIGDDTTIVNNYLFENNIIEYVDIVSFQPYSKLYTYYSIADIGIGLIEKEYADKFTKGGSRKLMEYMKASLALLVTKDGDVGRIVKDEHCGILADIWDEAELTKTINWLLSHPNETKEMGERGRLAFQQKYNWDKESIKFIEVYKNL